MPAAFATVSGQAAAKARMASAPYQKTAIARDGDGGAHAELRRRDAGRGEGEQARRQNLGQEKERKRGAPEPRPANLAVPDVLQPPPAERLLERLVDEAGVIPLGVDELGRGRVFGDLGPQSLNPAARFQDFAPPQHRLALGEAVTGGLACILPARLDRC